MNFKYKPFFQLILQMTRVRFTSGFLKGNITHKSRNYSVKYARQRYEKFPDEINRRERADANSNKIIRVNDMANKIVSFV